MKIVTTEMMKQIDQRAIEAYHIPGIVLMEHAAMALAQHIEHRFQQKDHILILCGPGNNGGDGFALARLLYQHGYANIKILCNTAFTHMTKDEAVFAAICGCYKIPIYQSESLDEVKLLLEEADAIVDALYGTGLSRGITGFDDTLICALNVCATYVLSVDIASGIHGDTGKMMGCAVQADETITFSCYKPGTIMYPGSAYCGKVKVVPISIPQVIIEEAEGITVIEDALVKKMLPKRVSHSNKSSYGKALMIGGSAQMHGAITLAAKAALRSGIGTLTLAIPGGIAPIIAAKMEECMLLPLADEHGMFAQAAVEQLKIELSHYDFIVIGNGMGRNDVSQALVELVLQSDLPCILDGDAIYAAGRNKARLQRHAPTILTPHPKEMSYVTGDPLQEILQAPITYAKEFMKQYPGITLVFKDEHTLIATNQKLYMNLAGNHALAKGGSGDVLCGMIAGLYGQSKDMGSSSICGVYVHAKIADLLIQEHHANSILPSDLIDHLSIGYHLLDEA